MTKNIDVDVLKKDWYSGICLRPLASKHNISAATAKTYLNAAGINTEKRTCFTPEVWNRIQEINKILDEVETQLTVRQIFYQMAVRGKIPLTTEGYHAIISTCTKGRKQGYIDWERIEDRTRQPKAPPMWWDKKDFFDTVLGAYRKSTWYNQPNYFEVWLEKNALFGIFWPITEEYGIKLQTITGYSSISAIYEGAKRLKDGATILYFGDHDATGVDIDRKLKVSLLEDHGINVNVKRIGLLYEDIEKYNLLPNPIKEGDKRSKEYKKRFEKQAELDALPPDILIDRLEKAIVDHLDMAKYNEMKKIQKEEFNDIVSRLQGVQK